MIGESELTIALVVGSVLIVFGLVPGVFAQLVEGVHNLLATLSPDSIREPEQAKQPAWLAIAGALLMGAAIVAYNLN